MGSVAAAFDVDCFRRRVDWFDGDLVGACVALFRAGLDWEFSGKSRTECLGKLETFRRSVDAGCSGDDLELDRVRTGRPGPGSTYRCAIGALDCGVGLLRRRNFQAAAIGNWWRDTKSLYAEG